MTPVRWRDPLGRDTLKKIVKKLIPDWANGLHAFQEDLICTILDGADIFCCTATGDGKSSAFSVPILAVLEYNQHPELYPAGLRTCMNPIGVVITPTKGLANNIVGSFFRVYPGQLSTLGARTWKTEHTCSLVLS